jgi:hypothetical protein
VYIVVPTDAGVVVVDIDDEDGDEEEEEEDGGADIFPAVFNVTTTTSFFLFSAFSFNFFNLASIPKYFRQILGAPCDLNNSLAATKSLMKKLFISDDSGGSAFLKYTWWRMVKDGSSSQCVTLPLKRREEIVSQGLFLAIVFAKFFANISNNG